MKTPKHVIKIGPNGDMICLYAEGKGLDLRKLGEVTFERVSIIDMDDTTQKFYIKFLAPHLLHFQERVNDLRYDTYAEAVKKEVEIVNDWLRSGKRIVNTEGSKEAA